MYNRIKGVIPIVLSPLKKNGDIDTDSCSNLIEFLVDNGAAGLFALGSASEGFLLDNEQRLKAVSAMAEANRGRVPLIVGCSNMAPRSVFQFFKMIKNKNVSGIHYIPEDLKIGEQRLIHLINSYADKAPFPFYLYHNIKRGRAITFKVAQAVKSHPNVLGIKVGGYDRKEMEAFLTLDNDTFQIFGSGGGQILDWLEFGAEAITASSSCCFPQLFSQMYNDFKSGNLEAAKVKQKLWNDFHGEIPNTAPDNGEYAAEEKYILKKLGVIKTDYCHFPYRQLSDNEKFIVDKALEKYRLETVV